jgi:hypothetical protein
MQAEVAVGVSVAVPLAAEWYRERGVMSAKAKVEVSVEVPTSSGVAPAKAGVAGLFASNSDIGGVSGPFTCVAIFSLLPRKKPAHA